METQLKNCEITVRLSRDKRKSDQNELNSLMCAFRLFLIIVDETNKVYYFFSPFSSAALNQMSVDFGDQIEEVSRCTKRTKPVCS